jgi:hypothetical protein
MFIKKLALPRRTFLRGMGATVALPLLDAGAAWRPRDLLAAVRRVHFGWRDMFEWTPPTEGVGFEPAHPQTARAFRS